VGNSHVPGRSTSAQSVHPHGRGELSFIIPNRAGVGGSSPRTWGTQNDQTGNNPDPRFIPTDVGNSCFEPAPQRSALVHPHGRGELTSLTVSAFTGIGSSPRTWGTLSGWSPRYIRSRFIPTDVGNSLAMIPHSPCLQVHPHGRGELDGGNLNVCRYHGSSPRTWGTLYLDYGLQGGIRFIPTDVGNSPPAASATTMFPVHPHGRGELVRSPIVAAIVFFGSSPRTWGTLHRTTHLSIC